MAHAVGPRNKYQDNEARFAMEGERIIKKILFDEVQECWQMHNNFGDEVGISEKENLES